MLKSIALWVVFTGIACAQCSSLTYNVFTRKLDCVGSGGGSPATVTNILAGTGISVTPAGTVFTIAIDGTVVATQDGNNAFTGTNTHSGSETFTGALDGSGATLTSLRKRTTDPTGACTPGEEVLQTTSNRLFGCGDDTAWHDLGGVTGGTCTNQFTRAISASGVPTCASVANADITNATIDLSAKVAANLLANANLSVAARSSSFGATFDGGGSALTSGTTAGVSLVYLVVPHACTVIAWDITVDAGTAGFRVWRKATGTAIPTVSDTVTSVGDLAIASGTALHSTTATNWSGGAFPTIAANDIVAIHLNAVATATFATFSATCQK